MEGSRKAKKTFVVKVFDILLILAVAAAVFFVAVFSIYTLGYWSIVVCLGLLLAVLVFYYQQKNKAVPVFANIARTRYKRLKNKINLNQTKIIKHSDNTDSIVELGNVIWGNRMELSFWHLMLLLFDDSRSSFDSLVDKDTPLGVNSSKDDEQVQEVKAQYLKEYYEIHTQKKVKVVSHSVSILVAMVALVMVIGFGTFLGGVDAAGCVTPKSGMIIENNTTLCSGTYSLTSGLSLKVYDYNHIADITLDCAGAKLIGPGKDRYGIGITTVDESATGVGFSIRNCILDGWSTGIQTGQNLMVFESPYFYTSFEFSNNTITNTTRGISIDGFIENTMFYLDNNDVSGSQYGFFCTNCDSLDAVSVRNNKFCDNIYDFYGDSAPEGMSFSLMNYLTSTCDSIYWQTGNAMSCKNSCPVGPVCGDDYCDSDNGENSNDCLTDCPASVPNCNFNNICEGWLGETLFSCANDCATCASKGYQICGSGTECNTGAISASDTDECCPGSCTVTTVCGDGTCNGDETSSNCPTDCPTCSIVSNNQTLVYPTSRFDWKISYANLTERINSNGISCGSGIAKGRLYCSNGLCSIACQYLSDATFSASLGGVNCGTRTVTMIGGTVCGDGKCETDKGETKSSCPADCSPSCTITNGVENILIGDDIKWNIEYSNFTYVPKGGADVGSSCGGGAVVSPPQILCSVYDPGKCSWTCSNYAYSGSPTIILRDSSGKQATCSLPNGGANVSDCTIPTSGMIIRRDTKFCSGMYNLGTGRITIMGGNTLDCNGAVLKGSREAIYHDNTGNTNYRTSLPTTIKNCVIEGFQDGISISAKAQIIDNVINVSGVAIGGRTYRNNIEGNDILGGTVDLFPYGVNSSIVKNNKMSVLNVTIGQNSRLDIENNEVCYGDGSISVEYGIWTSDHSSNNACKSFTSTRSSGSAADISKNQCDRSCGDAVCGDGDCEDDKGETESTCPADCGSNCLAPNDLPSDLMVLSGDTYNLCPDANYSAIQIGNGFGCNGSDVVLNCNGADIGTVNVDLVSSCNDVVMSYCNVAGDITVGLGQGEVTLDNSTVSGNIDVHTGESSSGVLNLDKNTISSISAYRGEINATYNTIVGASGVSLMRTTINDNFAEVNTCDLISTDGVINACSTTNAGNVCGDGDCEDDKGETESSCPADCDTGDSCQDLGFEVCGESQSCVGDDNTTDDYGATCCDGVCKSYNAISMKYGDLISYWKMGESSGQNRVDSVADNNLRIYSQTGAATGYAADCLKGGVLRCVFSIYLG